MFLFSGWCHISFTYNLSTIAAAARARVNTRAPRLSVVGSCFGRNETDDSFVCSGLDHYVEVMHATGTEDFTVTVSLALETVGDTAASVVFFSSAGEQNHVGIDSWFTTCTQPDGEGRCAAGLHIPTNSEHAPALVPGERTNLTFSRASNILSVRVNRMCFL
eukprot:COSAG02_NODE_876_length_16272_cov_138.802510_9_plen_162_part_00